MNEISVNYKTAAELNQKIIFTAQMAQQNLFKMCCMLKRMRDEKLYKELGYQSFETYCENEVGISRHMAYKYTDILEIKNVESIQHFGITKLSLLASLSESQQEEIQQNVNVEDISVRKLKEEIARLKEESESAGQRAENERQRRISAETDLLSAKSKNRSLTHDLDAANSRINELESRPVEVAVETDTKTLAENERLQQELEQARETITEMERTDTSYELKTAKAAVRNLDRQLSELAQESANEQNRIRQKYQKEINALREQLENSAYTTEVETVEVPATKEVFEAYCSIVKNAYAMLIDFVKSIGSDKEYTRAVDKMLDAFDNELCDIM
jgi:chromosome segregation ATPase